MGYHCSANNKLSLNALSQTPVSMVLTDPHCSDRLKLHKTLLQQKEVLFLITVTLQLKQTQLHKEFSEFWLRFTDSK